VPWPSLRRPASDCTTFSEDPRLSHRRPTSGRGIGIPMHEDRTSRASGQVLRTPDWCLVLGIRPMRGCLSRGLTIVTWVMCAACAHATDAQVGEPPVRQGQVSAPQLPCDFSGEVPRTKQGNAVQYTSAEMKLRATRRVDLSGFIKQADMRGTAIVDVLVGASGQVVCMKNSTSHLLIRVEVERALKSWTFRAAEVKGRRVAYLGRLEFTLCNILCGEQGPSMTLLK
jgi:hypothetical protein